MDVAVVIFEGNYDLVIDIPVASMENKFHKLLVQLYCTAMKTAIKYLLA